ncbi:transport and Golgi organization protein 6 homolog [Hetaerina americana]|uniref:transport and Golgi organization protein 6 homolog n=1 Tax=Hetaerina americana TaxID=62018 RepID=UPI003A7F6203
MNLSIKCYCEALCLLTDPPKGNKFTDLEEKFASNIIDACKSLSVEELSQLTTVKNYGLETGLNDVRWRWVVLALHIFLSMKECGNAEDMLSVRQEKSIRTTFEFVISLGLLPSLLPGVGIPLEKRCSASTAEWVKSTSSVAENSPISVIELYERLSAVTKILLSLIDSRYFCSLILRRHLCDILAALCQLSMAPLKKPNTDIGKGGFKENLAEQKYDPASSTGKSEQFEDKDVMTRIFSKPKEEVKTLALVSEIEEQKKKPLSNIHLKSNFQMTVEFWNRLQHDKQLFSRELKNLVMNTHQPLVIRDLLLLQGSPSNTGKGKLAPVWLRRGCASLLNSCLFRKGGILATVQAICDVFSVPQPTTDSWAQHMVLGKLVSMAISSKKDDVEWCKAICLQVIELLSANNLKNCNNYARAGVTCISMLLAAEKEICRMYIIDPLMEPLLLKMNPQDLVHDGGGQQIRGAESSEMDLKDKSNRGDSVKLENSLSESAVADERTDDILKGTVPKKGDGLMNDSSSHRDVNHCLSVLYFCFVENDPGMSLPSNLLAPVFSILLREYRDKTLGADSVSTISKLLVKFITNCPDDSVLFGALDSVLFEGSSSFESLKNMASRVGSDDDSSEPKNMEESLMKELLEKTLDIENTGKVVEIGGSEELGWGSSPLLELVSGESNGPAARVIFRYVLQALPKGGENVEKQNDWLISIAKQSVATQLLCHLLEVTSVKEQVISDPKDVVTFLGGFLAKEAEKVFKKYRIGKGMEGNNTPGDERKTSQRNCDSTLLNISDSEPFPSFLDFGLNEDDTSVLDEEQGDKPSEESHSEFVLVTLLILKSLCESPREKNEQEWWVPFREILPQVRAFRRESSCPEVRAMAEDVACAILTRGKSGSKNTGVRTQDKQTTSSRPREFRNEKQSENEFQYGAKKCSGSEDSKSKDASEGDIEFEEALAMTQENAVHLKGHALIMLSKLLSCKDPATLRHQTTLLQIFQENLKHDDSYIYLAAINGLEKLGYLFPDQVLETLSDEFAEISVVQAGNTAFNEVRLKVGEALLRVTRTLGEMAPKYSCLLLNSFLGGVRDGDGMVRASSLSNLGEVCKILSFKLGSITTEVLWCVRCVLETDSAVEARRAAVLVVTLLLQGMGVEVFKVLENILPELYRTLKSVRSNDPDEVVQLHAQLALEEVDRITMQFLFPPQKLEKKIFVLDPPS